MSDGHHDNPFSRPSTGRLADMLAELQEHPALLFTLGRMLHRVAGAWEVQNGLCVRRDTHGDIVARVWRLHDINDKDAVEWTGSLSSNSVIRYPGAVSTESMRKVDAELVKQGWALVPSPSLLVPCPP
jgi:hypothetical protein